MLDYLKFLDQTVFLFLNGLHCSFFDPLMFWGTKSVVWMPLYLGLLYLAIRQYKWDALVILLFVALMVLLSDQLSNVFKDWIARPRPSHEPGLSGIHTVNGYLGGHYGFYSAHGSTNLALAIFLILIFRGKFKYFPPLIILWAFFMAYTRIYLGVHYPGDIMAGWIAGSFIGFCTGLLCLRFVHQTTG